MRSGLTLFRVSEETYFGEHFGELVKEMLIQSVTNPPITTALELP